jgi:hypothetical protein
MGRWAQYRKRGAGGSPTAIPPPPEPPAVGAWTVEGGANTLEIAILSAPPATAAFSVRFAVDPPGTGFVSGGTHALSLASIFVEDGDYQVEASYIDGYGRQSGWSAPKPATVPGG